MRKEFVFPTILIILDLFASIMYIGKKPNMVIYWIAAAVLTAMITYFK